MARLEGQDLLDQMLASKQATIARRAAEGDPVPAGIAARSGSLMAGGISVYGEGAVPLLTTTQRLQAIAAGGAELNGKQPELAQAGLGGLIPAAGAALGALGISLPPALLTALGIGGALYGGAQALGLGEGEGLFGTDVLGGDTQYRNGIPFGGPGLAEPPAEWVEKEWHVSYDWGDLQYYLVRMPSGRKKIALYNTRTKRWKVWAWRTPRLAVIGKNMPSHKMITRLRRNLKKHSADARTILKMTSPTSLRTPKRRRR